MKTKTFVFLMIAISAALSVVCAVVSAGCMAAELHTSSAALAAASLMFLIVLLALLNSVKYEWKRFIDIEDDVQIKTELNKKMSDNITALNDIIKHLEKDKNEKLSGLSSETH